MLASRAVEHRQRDQRAHMSTYFLPVLVQVVVLFGLGCRRMLAMMAVRLPRKSPGGSTGTAVSGTAFFD